MVAILLIALAAHSTLSAPPQQPQQPDSSLSFANAATRALVARGIARHAQQDTSVRDYRAQIDYRLTVSLGRRRWGRFPVGSVEEQRGTVAWQLPNDLRVDIVGRRALARAGVPPLSSVFDRPWFVPRSVGDSVRIFSDEFPATGALHPLAADGPAYYHYDLTDSLTATIPGRHQIRLYAVQFTPRRAAPALIVGRLWLDASTAEVVRIAFRYVGTELWTRPDEDGNDSTDARRINRIVNGIVTIDADLEYGLQDNRYWMPYRQTIAGQVNVPVLNIVVPFKALTRFDDYDINTGRAVAFALPLPDTTLSDSARAAARRAAHDSVRAARERRGADSTRGWARAGQWPGGRFELHRPSNDSLSRYAGWTDSLSFDASATDDRRLRGVQSDLATLAEELPDDITLRKAHGFAYQNTGDALQYNRVQGLSLGVGYRERVPNTDFSDLYATVRYGFSDQRVTGRLALVRDAPAGRFTLSAYHDIGDVDPFSPGRTVANTASALFTAHDYGDYYLATGGGIGLVTALGTGLDLELSARGERQRSIVTRAHSGLNDILGGTGDFPANPAVDEGDYGGARVQLDGYGPLRWTLAADGLAGAGHRSGRILGSAQHSWGGVRGATLRVKAGYAASPVRQMLFRAGGMNTVRGFQYGTLTGPAFWSAQLDVSPLAGNIRPVLFIDAGKADAARQVFRGSPLVGGGIGVSMWSPLLRTTLLRLDLSHSITPDTGARWRFDVVLQAVR